MYDFIDSIQQLISVFINHYQIPVMILVILWAVHILNTVIGKRLSILGIIPRRWFGLPGIAFAPWLHGDFNHIFFNSIPLFILLNFMLVGGTHTFVVSSVSIILLSGFLTWSFARPGIHIGASALIMGYMGFLLTNAYFHYTMTSLILAVLCLYYFAGLLLGLLPTEVRVSWEGHVFGFISGVTTAFFLPQLLHFTYSFPLFS